MTLAAFRLLPQSNPRVTSWREGLVMPCHRRGSKSTGKSSDFPESDVLMDRGRPGPEWVLWAVCGSLSPREAGLRGGSAHAAAPGQVSFSNRTCSSKPGYGVPECFTLLTSDIAELRFAAHECPCFPACWPVLRPRDFLPREGISLSVCLSVLWACMSSVLPFDLFPLLCTPSCLLSAL